MRPILIDPKGTIEGAIFTSCWEWKVRKDGTMWFRKMQKGRWFKYGSKKMITKALVGMSYGIAKVNT